MPSDNLAVIRSLYAAFAVRDVPGVVALMHPDIVWHEAENFPYADTLDVARATGAA